ncbi:MAG: ATP-binding protein [Promicromonosporaceae bacterium]|nr:ATP-binding protein [Promicromonosporaceae bacterium]
MAGEDRTYTLSGFAVPAQLEAVHALLKQVATDHPELDPMDVMLFETAIIEIADNVVEHGRPQGEVQWTFTIRVREDEIEAVLDDTGQPFTPDTCSAMPDGYAEGGRGLPLAKQLLDRIEFSRFEDANHWRLTRRLGQVPPEFQI